MCSPTVSVVIPVYNGAATLPRAIKSVLSQTEAPLEIIVVDDGSQDESAAVASQFPVKLIQQENAGPAAARNRGAELSKGEWIAFLDADDAWLPTKIERQVQYVDRASIGLLHCYVRRDHRRGAQPAVVTFERLWKRNCICTSTTLVRRVAFEQLGGFNKEPSIISVEDYNLWLRMAAHGWQIITIPEVLCEYMPTSTSLSRQVERFALAELANVSILATELRIPDKQVREKRAAVYKEYGSELVCDRKLPEARSYLNNAFRTRPSVSTLGWLLVTLSPEKLLDFRRRFGASKRSRVV